MKEARPTKFRKKPVEVEAFKFTRYNDAEVLRWMGVDPDREFGPDWKAYSAIGGIVIRTLEGEMLASPGDWVVRGVHGEFYPVKPAIFEATYEEVSQ